MMMMIFKWELWNVVWSGLREMIQGSPPDRCAARGDTSLSVEFVVYAGKRIPGGWRMHARKPLIRGEAAFWTVAWSWTCFFRNAVAKIAEHSPLTYDMHPACL
jgi:hypothetical protein